MAAVRQKVRHMFRLPERPAEHTDGVEQEIGMVG